MAHWLYFIHPPRESFIETITPAEAAIMRERHYPYLAQLFEQGVLILAGPTWGESLDSGVAIIEADSRDDAEAIMLADPAVTSGLMTAELREMRVSFLRGRA